MKYYGKSEQVCNSIIDQFRTGNVPNVLSQVFVQRSDDIPSNKWSWNNRFIVAISGANDARGYKQWQQAGRKVKKGSKALYILAPCVGNVKEKDDTGNETEKRILFGFRTIPVFARKDTDIVDPELWAKNSSIDVAEEQRLQELPFREVADRWGINVTSYNGKNSSRLGCYSNNGTISLGVENLSTWAHELVHAADDRNNTLTIGAGQQPDNEIVAELGGATLLKMMGYDTEADIGGAWQYIQQYAKKGKEISLCCKLLNRICECITIILEATTEQIAIAA